MKVKVLSMFRDLKEGVIRQEKEVFCCSKERYQEILQKGNYVEEFLEPEEEKEVMSTAGTKKRSKKEKGAG